LHGNKNNAVFIAAMKTRPGIIEYYPFPVPTEYRCVPELAEDLLRVSINGSLQSNLRCNVELIEDPQDTYTIHVRLPGADTTDRYQAFVLEAFLGELGYTVGRTWRNFWRHPRRVGSPDRHFDLARPWLRGPPDEGLSALLVRHGTHIGDTNHDCATKFVQWLPPMLGDHISLAVAAQEYTLELREQWDALDHLDKANRSLQRRIIEWRYGLRDGKRRSWQAVATKVPASFERVIREARRAHLALGWDYGRIRTLTPTIARNS
jgi:hypothetical protein